MLLKPPKTAFQKYFYFLAVVLLSFSSAECQDEAETLKTKIPIEIKICLTMIVRNESKIIERCLDNVQNSVDCISICDTGSTDGTPDIIEAYLKKNNIPGRVYHHSWLNFGHNRSLSAKAAKDTLNALGFSLPHTYLLLLDADMVFVAAPEFDKQQLTKDEYYLVQKSSLCSHYNVRLIKASLPWTCVGATHEHWTCAGKSSSEKLKTLWIDDRDDGGCKADKFERDLQFLTKGLEEEPDNVRYMFYLAQSYMCLKRNDEAIKWYKERIARQGWMEEVWYSMFKIGEIYESNNEWDKALKWYLEAYQYNPERAEALERIAAHYRVAGQNDLACMFAFQGAKIGYPNNQVLFISDYVYKYRFDEELSIAAYYTPFRDEGFAAIERLQVSKEVPASVKLLAEKNSRFYISTLKDVRFLELPIDPPSVREGSNLRTNPMNPSILRTEEGYKVICRCVNYRQEGAQNYSMIDPEEKEITVKTRNYLLEYDKNFHLLSQKEIIDGKSLQFRHPPYSLIIGLEDSRIFYNENALWATCTAQDLNEFHVPQIALYRLSKEPSNDQQILLDHFVLVQGPDSKRCEKNWLPFVKDGQIYAIYSYDPFVVFKIDSLSGQIKEVINRKQKKDFSSFRGSGGPIPFDDGYLVMVHYVTYDQGRFYFHRFLYMDKDFNITQMSRPFTFKNQRVEYCCGMTADHSNSQIVISIGIEDRQAFLAMIDFDKVRAQLLPIE